MPQLTINNNTFNYPDPGQDPGWGEDATGWAESVTEVLNTLLAPGDILQTSFSVANNVASPSNVVGLFFDGATVRAANISYAINRTSNTNPYGINETGTIYLNYDGAAPLGSKWTLSQQKHNDAGVTFSVNDSGQILYTSTDIGATNYQGTMKFSAKTLSQ